MVLQRPAKPQGLGPCAFESHRLRFGVQKSECRVMN